MRRWLKASKVIPKTLRKPFAGALGDGSCSRGSHTIVFCDDPERALAIARARSRATGSLSYHIIFNRIAHHPAPPSPLPKPGRWVPGKEFTLRVSDHNEIITSILSGYRLGIMEFVVTLDGAIGPSAEEILANLLPYTRMGIMLVFSGMDPVDRETMKSLYEARPSTLMPVWDAISLVVPKSAVRSE
jgi:hypothetical protein